MSCWLTWQRKLTLASLAKWTALCIVMAQDNGKCVVTITISIGLLLRRNKRGLNKLVGPKAVEIPFLTPFISVVRQLTVAISTVGYLFFADLSCCLCNSNAVNPVFI